MYIDLVVFRLFTEVRDDLNIIQLHVCFQYTQAFQSHYILRVYVRCSILFTSSPQRSMLFNCFLRQIE